MLMIQLNHSFSESWVTFFTFFFFFNKLNFQNNVLVRLFMDIFNISQLCLWQKFFTRAFLAGN